ncbi:MFS transporter [Streptomonospora litoralis]|uniref:Multidrug resistance protein stp n=1 Tax=Streptomonospora litoralis TaxID=2498135 RepID=A0A4P6Q1Z9_9ACTN|nr:MFS transporter [Streptomonospora litoralis]QBI54628.1 Multidrug resistance protein stp [Streptomonospora litoralis]
MGAADSAATSGGGVAWGSPAARWMLTATVLASGMAFLDSTVVNVALPAIGAELDAGVAGLQWTVNGYMVTLSALILLSGSLSDRFGRVRVFAVGVAWFALASALCSLAPGLGWLIAGRLLQGVGGALLTPGSLAILQAGFRKRDRARAIGAWSGLTGVASAVGPFVGGWLVEIGSWRLIFLINLPLAAAVLLIAWLRVPESRDTEAPERLDYTGALLAMAGLAALTYALIEAGETGFGDWRVLAPAAAGLTALAAFAAVERRSHHPMLPLDIFASSRFTVTNVVTVLMYGSLGPLLFLLVIYLQEVMGYSPVEAGAASLPITALMLALSGQSGRLAERVGPRWQLTIGPLVLGAGLVVLSGLAPGDSYLTGVLPGVLLVGLGLSTAVAPLTATVLASAAERHAGVASGVNNTLARTAQLMGVAAVPVLAGVNGPAGISGGFGPAMLIIAGAAAGAGLLAAALLRRRPRAPASKRMFCGVSGPPLSSCPGSSASEPLRRGPETS